LDAAIPILQSVADNHHGTEEARDAVLALGEVYYRMGKYTSSLSTLEESAAELDKSGRAGRRLILSGLSCLRLNDKDGAIENARKVAPDSSMHSSAVLLENAATGCPEAEKSPFLAGILSAVLPGAGQLYVGRRRDAVMAFALNGLFVFGLVSAFQNDEPVAGSVLAIIETAWYSGNVYGAVNGAHKRNAVSRERFFSEVEFHLNILGNWTPNGSSLKPAAGVGVRF
jgi:tetratricopeptide (TPR) repeat protein